MADCLVPDSQPEQNEPLVVITPETLGFNVTDFFIVVIYENFTYEKIFTNVDIQN